MNKTSVRAFVECICNISRLVRDHGNNSKFVLKFMVHASILNESPCSDINHDFLA